MTTMGQAESAAKKLEGLGPTEVTEYLAKANGCGVLHLQQYNEETRCFVDWYVPTIRNLAISTDLGDDGGWKFASKGKALETAYCVLGRYKREAMEKTNG